MSPEEVLARRVVGGRYGRALGGCSAVRGLAGAVRVREGPAAERARVLRLAGGGVLVAGALVPYGAVLVALLRDSGDTGAPRAADLLRGRPGGGGAAGEGGRRGAAPLVGQGGPGELARLVGQIAVGHGDGPLAGDVLPGRGVLRGALLEGPLPARAGVVREPVRLRPGRPGSCHWAPSTGAPQVPGAAGSVPAVAAGSTVICGGT
ncbi:hypothetical protein SHKM778_83720 [Streptomyces sp. KM77-8]|uniref:Uncharacterized protein n=1 Tax=Streptomyces haneummycinicus TaxID=3074435 RepID=A0AAT9HWI0_9ACTN